MKNFKNLTGAKTLSKTEQKSIKGGTRYCQEIPTGAVCPKGYVCIDNECEREM